VSNERDTRFRYFDGYRLFGFVGGRSGLGFLVSDSYSPDCKHYLDWVVCVVCCSPVQSESKMKKLTVERKAVVEAAILSGRASYAEYKAKQLTTFSDEGRKIIKGYWDAQAVILDTLSASMSRTDDLIAGKITLDDLYNEDGTARKVGR